MRATNVSTTSEHIAQLSADFTFTATDNCGNHQATTGTFVIQDTRPLFKTLPQDRLFVNDGTFNTNQVQMWLANHGGAEVNPDFDPTKVVWTHTIDDDFTRKLPNTQCGDGVKKATFTASHPEWLRPVSMSAAISVQDQTPPQFTAAPQDVQYTISKYNTEQLERWLASFGEAIAKDETSVPRKLRWGHKAMPELRITKWTTCPDKVQTFHFTVNDECNNTVTSQAATFSTVAAPPKFTTRPQSMQMESDGFGHGVNTALQEWIESNGGGATQSSTFDNITWSHDAVHFEDLGCVGNQTAHIRFTATDVCQRSIVGPTTFSVVDTSTPQIKQHAKDTIVQDDGQGNSKDLSQWLSTSGGAVASDLASGPTTWRHDFQHFAAVEVSSGCVKRMSTTTFTASDGCMNQINSSAVFTIIDSRPPDITVAATPLSLEIGDLADDKATIEKWANSNAHAVAIDHMNGPVQWSVSVLAPPIVCAMSSTTPLCSLFLPSILVLSIVISMQPLHCIQ